MNIFTPYHIVNEMAGRYERHLSLREALVNLLKDYLRLYYTEFSASTDRVAYADFLLSKAVQTDLVNKCQTSDKIWDNTPTKFGATRRLNHFGSWLHNLVEYHQNATQTLVNDIIKAAIKEVG
jgi:hypothetical protein